MVESTCLNFQPSLIMKESGFACNKDDADSKTDINNTLNVNLFLNISYTDYFVLFIFSMQLIKMGNAGSVILCPYPPSSYNSVLLCPATFIIRIR